MHILQCITLLSSALNIGQLMNWTMARLLHMTWHASDVISIQQVTVVAVTASHPASHVGFLKGITHEYYTRILPLPAVPRQNSAIISLIVLLANSTCRHVDTNTSEHWTGPSWRVGMYYIHVYDGHWTGPSWRVGMYYIHVYDGHWTGPSWWVGMYYTYMFMMDTGLGRHDG